MAWPPHVLVAFGGTLVGGETWTCGVRGLAISTGTLADCDAYLSDIHTPLNSWWTNIAYMTSNNATLGWVKANNINSLGHYADPVTHQYIYTSPSNGAATPNMPPFCCCRISWSTNSSRGVAHHGGIYLPVCTTVTQNTNVFAAGDVAKYVAAGKQLLTVLNNTGGGTSHTLVPNIVSPGTAKNGHLGVAQPITGVRVGNVVDVQRRRKAQMVEAYTASVWP